jgi:hypothetical protein
VPVTGDSECVDHHGVPKQVQQLASVADAVRSSEPETVVEAAVERLGVVAPPEQVSEVGIGRRDRANVLGSVELAGSVAGVVVDTTKAKRDLGWAPQYTALEALHDTFVA